jgi:drug/metabolite transporter (DMT)-like permease
MVGAMVVLLGLAALPGNWRDVARCFRPSREWRVLVPAAVIGAYLAMVLWIAGMKYTFASTASVLNQTSAIFTLILATVFLRERLTVRKSLAILLGFAGGAIAVL